MNYEAAAERYVKAQKELEELDHQYKQAKAPLLEKIALIENWFTVKAKEDGLETIKTSLGTGYWATHSSASVGSRDEFFRHCKEHDTWDLVEARASKTGVRSYIEAHGTPPPGVNFSSVRVFNFRKAQAKE